MLKTLKNRQVLDLAEGLARIEKKELKNSTAIFNYAVLLNQDIVSGKGQAIIKMSNVSEDYIEFENKKEELIKGYAEKDENENIIYTDENQNWAKIKEGCEEELKQALNKFVEENKSVIEKREKDIEDFKKVLDEEVELDIYEIDIKDIPDEIGRDLQLMRFIMTMIKR